MLTQVKTVTDGPPSCLGCPIPEVKYSGGDEFYDRRLPYGSDGCKTLTGWPRGTSDGSVSVK